MNRYSCQKRNTYTHVSLRTNCVYLLSWSKFTTNIQFPLLLRAALGIINCDIVGHKDKVFSCLFVRVDLLYLINKQNK